MDITPHLLKDGKLELPPGSSGIRYLYARHLYLALRLVKNILVGGERRARSAAPLETSILPQNRGCRSRLRVRAYSRGVHMVWGWAHLRSRSFQHLDTRVTVIIDSCNVEAAAAAAVAAESLAHLAVKLVLEQEHWERLQEPAIP